MIASTYAQIHYSQSILSNSSFYFDKFTASAGGAAAATNSSPSAVSSTASAGASVASTAAAATDTGASTAASTAAGASASASGAGSATATGRPSSGKGRGVSTSYPPVFFWFLLTQIWIFSLAEVRATVKITASNRSFVAFFSVKTKLFFVAQ